MSSSTSRAKFRQDGFPLDYIVQDWQYWRGQGWHVERDDLNKDRFPILRVSQTPARRICM